MRKSILSSILILFTTFAFGQSVTILPQSTTNQSNTGGENINVTANSNSLGIYGRRFNGTFALKTPVLSGDELFRVSSGGWWGTGPANESQNAAIKFNATENWGSGSGSKISFTTTPNGGTSQLERMVINHDGNVGIGSTTPLGKLQIDHNTAGSDANPHLRLRHTNNSTSGKIRMENADGTRYFMQHFWIPSATASNNSYSLYYGNDLLLNVRGDGKFGLNVPIPLDLLHLAPISNTGDVYTRISSTTGLTGIRLQNNTGDWAMYTNEFSKLFFGYSTNDFTTTSQVLILEPDATEYNFVPSTTNQVYLGRSGQRWREIWSQNALNTSSDRRLKKNIVEIKYGLADVLKLNAVTYNWKNGSDSKLHLGFIAQDVDKIIPEIVSKSNLSDEEYARLEKEGKPINDTYGMEYTGLIPVLVKAIQEQQQIIEDKALKISQLEEKLKKMGDLEARLSAIESVLNKPIQESKSDKK